MPRPSPKAPILAIDTTYALKFNASGLLSSVNVAELEVLGFSNGAADMDDGARALTALLAPSLAGVAVDALMRPEVFRAAASYYGYTPDKPLPDRLAIGGALKYLDDGRVCATKKKGGPCLLVFTNVGGTWKLSGFEGDLSDLRGRPKKPR